MKNTLNVVVDKDVGHVITVTADVQITVSKGKADLADLLAKAVVEQVRNKVANYTEGTYTVRLQCVVLEQTNATGQS